MPISDLFSGSITEQTILGLINEGVEEFSHLDYKSQIPLNSDSQKKELAKDVSAFANSGGGVLIYGVREEGHKPVEITGINPNDTNKEKIENVILSCISPRISKQIIPVDLEGREEQVFVIIIDQSSNAPHMVTKQQDNRYYKRHDFSSIVMEEHEVRHIYERSGQMFKEIDNIMKKKNYCLIDPNDDGKPWLCIMSIPYIIEHDRISPSDQALKNWLNPNERKYDGMSFLPGFPRPSIEGFMIERRNRAGEHPMEEFVTVGREAYVQYSKEVYISEEAENDTVIPYTFGPHYVKDTICYFNFLAEFYNRIEYYGLIKVRFAINNLPTITKLWPTGNARQGTTMFTSAYRGATLIIDRDFQTVKLAETPNLVAKDVLDQFYNAFSYEHCHLIQEDGTLAERGWR